MPVTSQRVASGALTIAFLLSWAAFSFWLFSFSYSSSFFQYNLPSRLPPFAAAVLGALALPISAACQWRRVRRRTARPLRAWLSHCLWAAASVVPLLVVAALVAHAPGPWRSSADDAMGTGIDFLLLVGMAIASAVLLGVALVIRNLVRRRRRTLEVADG